MKQTSGPAKKPAEAVIKDIGRATRPQFSSEEKIRVVLESLRGEDSIANCADVRGSPPRWTTAGPRSSWRLARSACPATRLVRPPRMRCGIYVAKRGR